MDQSRDLSGREFYRLTRVYTAPEFVKQAVATDLSGTAELPAEVYGDPRYRLFPCHNAAATWASMAFFTDKRASFKQADAQLIEERILRMARIHNIEKPIAQIKEAAVRSRPVPEDSLPDEDFALVWQAGGKAERHYPLRNAGEVKTAGQYLYKHRDTFPFEIRREFADRVLDKAASLGAALGQELQDYLTKQAGYGACSTEDAVNLIYDRVQAARKGPGRLSELQVEMLKFAAMIGKSPARFRAAGTRCKVAAVVDQFDREQGLTKDYGPDFPRVEDVLFAITREKAAAITAEHCETVTGSIYSLADLERIKLAEIADYFGDDFAANMTSDGIRVDSEKAAQFIGTLPRRDAQGLEKFLDDNGLRPVAKTAAARVGFSDAHYRAMSQQRKPVMSVR